LAALVVGAGLMLVRVDPDASRTQYRTLRGRALYRFRAFRYGVASVPFVLAALSMALWIG